MKSEPQTVIKMDGCAFGMSQKKKRPSFFFGKVKVEVYNTRIDEASERILPGFHDIIGASPLFSQIRWHDEANFIKGNEDGWTSTPYQRK